uniref:Guanylate cyclase n=1 Tax=Poecilia reticulata TaxID=8081 RepID=A0A3P9PUZ1_POERE
MRRCGWWLLLCAFWVGAARGRGNGQCMDGVTINVLLLEDEESPWSLKYVERKILEAIEKDTEINAAEAFGFNLTANFEGFNTTIYRQGGCYSSPCEAVETLSLLRGLVSSLPAWFLCVFSPASAEKGFGLSTPIISAGSFGPSCDFALNLQRVLPPARKISHFFSAFWQEDNPLKPVWKTAYIYKKPNNTEDCFWSVAPQLILFIICGSVSDLLEMKNDSRLADSSDFLFILIDLYKSVLTPPQPLFTSPDLICFSTFFSFICLFLLCLLYWFFYFFMFIMNDYMAAYHDSVLHIGNVMREIASKNQSEIQQMEFVNVNYFRNVVFNGIAGEYKLDEYGDRDVNFSIMYTTTDLQYKCLFTFDTEKTKTKMEDESPAFIWGKKLPDYMPEDDGRFFTSQRHADDDDDVFVFRQNRKDRLLRKRWSHINSDLISLLEDSEHNIISLQVSHHQRITSSCCDLKNIVILKELKNCDGNFNKEQTRDLNALLHIDYYNLTKFYGTVRFDEGVFGVFEYGERGSLRYVLDDKVSYPEDTFMDWEFKISVMYDIAKGMSYLHSSNIQVHGRLKSTNCVVDNRMVVKITDFGCNAFLSSSKDLWTAPEHLRNQGTSQKGDVYSFAVISQEIVLRRSTFYSKSCFDRSEKLYRVKTSYFRPDLDAEMASEKELEVYMMIKSCWDEDPEKRPDFKKVENCLGKNISKIHNQDNESYMDNMIRRLQNYSRNLEHLVEERTSLYKAERDRADFLNFMLLPGPVVKSLKESGVVEPELYDEVTIYFSDIVGFTTLCQYSTPMEVVDMLNDIYKGFDSILDHHDVYKVETIGDAYMVASGLPRRNGNRHAVDICRMALDILSFMGTFQLRHLPGIPVWIRIGVHSGPCAAGVVGMKMPRYCLFGDTVNTASRMESSGQPLRIHVSEPTIHILQRTDCKFQYEIRGETYLKGKGMETTYWLTGETGEDYDLPTPPTTENVQRLQQDLANMILTCLERRRRGSVRRRKVPTGEEEEEDEESEVESEGGHLEYLQLATVENTLSTFL